MCTSYWYYLHVTFGLKVRFAKRQAARRYRYMRIQLKQLNGWHLLNDFNAKLRE